MGISIYYRSMRPVTPAENLAIRKASEAAAKERTWLICEPVCFFSNDDGHLAGGSKPNFQPHLDDKAAAAREGLPDGTPRDVLALLSLFSRDYGIDWEISHDHSGGPLGYIRGGRSDPDVLFQIEAFADLGDILDELE